MNVAFIVNASMVIVSAAAFYNIEDPGMSIEDAYHALTPLLGNMASYVFGAALLASGLSSSAVGTLAGEIILNGFVGLKIPLLVRRIITMTPGIIIICTGYNVTNALVLSQVVLSFCLPGAIIPMIILSNNVNIMGPEFANTRLVRWVGYVVAGIVISFNVFLIIVTILQPLGVTFG
jgi:manganese transport protein